jgi:hypothetical protein
MDAFEILLIMKHSAYKVCKPIMFKIFCEAVPAVILRSEFSEHIRNFALRHAAAEDKIYHLARIGNFGEVQKYNFIKHMKYFVEGPEANETEDAEDLLEYFEEYPYFEGDRYDPFETFISARKFDICSLLIDAFVEFEDMNEERDGASEVYDLYVVDNMDAAVKNRDVEMFWFLWKCILKHEMITEEELRGDFAPAILLSEEENLARAANVEFINKMFGGLGN